MAQVGAQQLGDSQLGESAAGASRVILEERTAATETVSTDRQPRTVTLTETVQPVDSVSDRHWRHTLALTETVQPVDVPKRRTVSASLSGSTERLGEQQLGETTLGGAPPHESIVLSEATAGIESIVADKVADAVVSLSERLGVGMTE